MSLAWIFAFGILEENENNPARVLDIQKYVNRQYDSCSRKKFMKVLETLVHAMGNDEALLVICMLATRRPEIIIWTK